MKVSKEFVVLVERNMFRFFLLVGLIMTSAMSFASVTLYYPEDFDVLVVNGEEYKSTWVSKNKGKLDLDTDLASQQVVMRYRQVFDDGDDFDVVKSKAFSIEFKLVAGMDQLYLVFDQPSDADAAKRYAKKPEVGLSSIEPQKRQKKMLSEAAGSSLVSVTLAYDVDQRSWLESFVSSDSSSSSGVVVSQPVAEIGQASDEVPRPKQSAISQLFFWWDQASASERETFLNHVSSSSAGQ